MVSMKEQIEVGGEVLQSVFWYTCSCQGCFCLLRSVISCVRYDKCRSVSHGADSLLVPMNVALRNRRVVRSRSFWSYVDLMENNMIE